MKKNCKKKGSNVGHDPMYLCFYDHNFPYVVRNFNFKNSFSFAHTRFIFNAAVVCRGGSREGHPARAPPKIGKNKIFWRKIVIFHTK